MGYYDMKTISKRVLSAKAMNKICPMKHYDRTIVFFSKLNDFQRFITSTSINYKLFFTQYSYYYIIFLLNFTAITLTF